MSETRPCSRCKGTGKDSEWHAGEACIWCHGVGLLPGPNVGDIVGAMTRRLPSGKRAFRKSKPTGRRNTVDGARAYYVWRLARFHGGADVTMPVVAQMLCGNDPWLEELDQIAEAVAKQVFGTDMAAAHRWGRALGYLDRDVPGLPESAYAGGPVVTSGEKPVEETPELEG